MKLVFIENNRPVTDSLTVAQTFGKTHMHVMRDIREMECSEEFRASNFGYTPYVHPQNGQTYEKVIMTQDGFAFLAFGYTGREAARFKEMYIGEFNRMRDELNKPKFQLPQTFSESLYMLAEKVAENERIAAENERLATEREEQEKKLKDQEAPVAIYNLAISAHNTMSMQEVAKSLNTGRTRLYNILREERIIMKGSTMPYQRYIEAGYFKVVERPRASGDTVQNDPATRVYAKGFDFIAKLMKRRSEKQETA